jgi:copper transport protein
VRGAAGASGTRVATGGDPAGEQRAGEQAGTPAHERRGRRPASSAWATLFRTVRLEALGLAGVVAITGVLTTLVPARTAAGVDGPYSEYAALGEYQLNVTIDPNRVGRNEFHFYLLGPDGRLTDDVREIDVGLSLPSAGIGPFDLEPDFVTPGHWTTAGDQLTIPGEWEVQVSARVAEFDQAETTLPVRVNP